MVTLTSLFSSKNKFTFLDHLEVLQNRGLIIRYLRSMQKVNLLCISTVSSLVEQTRYFSNCRALFCSILGYMVQKLQCIEYKICKKKILQTTYKNLGK